MGHNRHWRVGHVFIPVLGRRYVSVRRLCGCLPQRLIAFILIALFSLLVKLSRHQVDLGHRNRAALFKASHAFAFVKVLKCLLCVLSPASVHLFVKNNTILKLLLKLGCCIGRSRFRIFNIAAVVVTLVACYVTPVMTARPS